MRKSRLAIDVEPFKARFRFAARHMHRALDLFEHVLEIHARRGIKCEYIGERWFARDVKVSENVTQVDDASRYEINCGILEVLIETVVVAVPNHCVRDGLCVGDLVIGFPSNL